jgi:hypothetical protein
MRGRTAVLVAGLGALALAGRAVATSVIPMTLGEVACEADDVVHARVLDARAAWGPHLGHEAIVTTVTLGEEEALKGEPVGTLDLFGGQVGDQRMTLEGQPELRAGDEVVLFLSRRPLECPLIGVWQGAYFIRDGHVFRQGRRVVDVVHGRVCLGRDNDLPMTAAAFLDEVRRAVALDAEALAAERAQADADARACGCGRRVETESDLPREEVGR